jgi:hypothetical protein
VLPDVEQLVAMLAEQRGSTSRRWRPFRLTRHHFVVPLGSLRVLPACSITIRRRPSLLRRPSRTRAWWRERRCWPRRSWICLHRPICSRRPGLSSPTIPKRRSTFPAAGGRQAATGLEPGDDGEVPSRDAEVLPEQASAVSIEVMRGRCGPNETSRWTHPSSEGLYQTTTTARCRPPRSKPGSVPDEHVNTFPHAS